MSESDSLFYDSIMEAFPSLSEETVNRLHLFYSLLLKYNESHDLSRLTKISDIIEKHFIDSIIVNTLTELPASLLDIGTGAGFPGIPIKIVNPALKIILADPRPMRVEFMEKAISALNLDKTRVFPHKVNEQMFFHVQGVITRAFESTGATLERCVNFLPCGGKIVLLKGPGVDDELGEIPENIQEHYSLSDDIHYSLPSSPQNRRRLVIFTKTSTFTRRFFALSEIPELTAGRPIISPANQTIKGLKKTAAGGGIKKTGKTMFSGAKVIGELIDSCPERASELIIYETYSTSDSRMLSLIDHFDSAGKLIITKKSIFNELDTGATRQPLCVMDVPPLADYPKGKEIPSPVMIIPFQDPVNTGSAIRSAAAFGVKTVIITKEGVNPFHHKSIRSSAGTVFSASIYSGPAAKDLLDFCRDHGLTPLPLDMQGTPLHEYAFPSNFALIPGIEGPGLPENLKKFAVSVPIEESVESLNAAVTSSIVLYDYYRRK